MAAGAVAATGTAAAGTRAPRGPRPGSWRICSKHPDTPSEGVCTQCSKGWCTECAQHHATAAICPECDALCVKTADKEEAERVARAIDDDFEGPPCYRLDIENLTMAETLETDQHPRGGNIIEVLVGFRGGSTTRFLRARLRGRVLYEQDYWDPPGGVFALDAQDFEALQD